MARGLKFRIQIVDPCSENKDFVQLRGYHEADLRLCFHICKKPVFSERDSNIQIREAITKMLTMFFAYAKMPIFF